MPGGRPSQGKQSRRPWLEELAVWFESGLSTRAQSRRAFAQATGLDYKALGHIANAERLPTEDAVRYLSVLFGQSWERVEGIWRRAEQGEREARYRLAAVTVEPLRDWSKLPVLGVDLEELLDAQCEATDNLPYKLLDVNQPRLSEVYVQQHVKERGIADEDAVGLPHEVSSLADDKPQPQNAIALSTALTSYRHLLVTGEPGAGKSTLSLMYARKIARFWLGVDRVNPPIEEPALPVRISAQRLVGEKAWTQLLADAVQGQLGGMLTRRINQDLFAGRVAGAQWILFIDGLDEIVDPETRACVLQIIARQMRRSDAYRIVLTTRPLHAAQSKILQDASVGQYSLKPFGPDEVGDFAAAWFRAQDPVNAADRAKAFTTQLRDRRLKSVVRNPLLLTIAAIVNTREPSRPLPSNRVGLYEQFVSYLLDESTSGRNVLDSIEHAGDWNSARTAFAKRVLVGFPNLVGHLAVQQLEGKLELSASAFEWIEESVGSSEISTWRADVIELLLALGVFVRDGDSIRFLHYSFAEFLAAKEKAAAIGSSFHDLDSWIERALERSKEQFGIFTFVKWTENPRHDVNIILSRLLSGGREWLTLAGNLVAELPIVEDELAIRLGDRLINVLLSIEAPTEASLKVCRSMAGWRSVEANLHMSSRMRHLAERKEVSVGKRLLLASAIAFVTDERESERFFEDLALQVSPHLIGVLSAAWVELFADGASRAETAFLARAARSPQSAAYYVLLAEALTKIDRKDAARSVLQVPLSRITGEVNTPSLEDLNKWQIDGTFTREVGLVLANPDDCATLARLAGELGERGSCAQIAWAAIRSPGCKVVDLAEAARALLQVDSEQAPALASAASDMADNKKMAVARVLRDVGYASLAFSIAEAFLREGWRSSPWEVSRAIELIASDASGDISSAVSMVENWPQATAYHYAVVGQAVKNAGQIESGRILAVRALEDPRSDSWDCGEAARVLLGSVEGMETIERLSSTLSEEQLAGVVEALLSEDLNAPAMNLLRQRSGVWMASSYRQYQVVEMLIKAGERDTAMDWMNSISKTGQGTLGEVADSCAALLKIGEEVDVPQRIGPLLNDNNVVNERPIRELISAWCAARGGEAVVEIVGMVKTYGTDHRQAIAIGDQLLQRGLLDEAVEVWLSVLDWYPSWEGALTVSGKIASCGCIDVLSARLDVMLQEVFDYSGVEDLIKPLKLWVQAIGE